MEKFRSSFKGGKRFQFVRLCFSYRNQMKEDTAEEEIMNQQLELSERLKNLNVSSSILPQAPYHSITLPENQMKILRGVKLESDGEDDGDDDFEEGDSYDKNPDEKQSNKKRKRVPKKESANGRKYLSQTRAEMSSIIDKIELLEKFGNVGFEQLSELLKDFDDVSTAKIYAEVVQELSKRETISKRKEKQISKIEKIVNEASNTTLPTYDKGIDNFYKTVCDLNQGQLQEQKNYFLQRAEEIERELTGIKDGINVLNHVMEEKTKRASNENLYMLKEALFSKTQTSIVKTDYVTPFLKSMNLKKSSNKK